MYLTKLTLNPRSAQARRDLGDAFEMHRTLVRAFVTDPQSSPPRFLWRLEPFIDSMQGPIVLVQSQERGDWGVLDQLPNYLLRPAETKKVELARLVRLGRRYRFLLLANPTVSRKGKRLALLQQNEQAAWIERQGDRHGFFIQSLVVRTHDLLNRSGAEKAPICVQRVCFEGFLEVRQTAAFERALVAGIGPAKAFGCGLLSVAPC
jgi:CRISPR system Cascade subunit CasE